MKKMVRSETKRVRTQEKQTYYIEEALNPCQDVNGHAPHFRPEEDGGGMCLGCSGPFITVSLDKMEFVGPSYRQIFGVTLTVIQDVVKITAA